MGYTSTASGVIRINPPLNHQELRNLPDLEAPYGAEIELLIREERTDVDGGELVTRTAPMVQPLQGDCNMKRYDTASQLKRLVSAFPEHEFTGHFEFVGEDGDRWRTVMKEGKVLDDVKPELRWPE